MSVDTFAFDKKQSNFEEKEGKQPLFYGSELDLMQVSCQLEELFEIYRL